MGFWIKNEYVIAPLPGIPEHVKQSKVIRLVGSYRRILMFAPFQLRVARNEPL